ncbi:MAG: YbaY family lipoprotein [Gemmatimonadaceae bacterium]
MAARFLFLMVALPGFIIGCAPGGTRAARTTDSEGVVTGSVTYRERMALPPDAVVEVRLFDVSRQDVAAPVIADTTILPGGRQVPIPFALRYDPGRIEPNRTYAIRATIRSGVQMLFTTDAVHRVITQGNPTRVDLSLVRVAAEPDSASGGLVGTTWRLEDLGGTGVLDRVEATLAFPEVGKVAGSGSCNRFFGTVEISGESIRFGPLGSTRMACVEAVGIQEGKYLKALQDAARFTLDGSTLLIYSKGMEKPLRFVPKEP